MAPQAREAHDRSIYWSFWMLGAGVLLSWNVLLCSLPLFISFLPAQSTLRNTLTSYISTAFTFISLIMMGVAQKGVGKVSPSARLHSSLWTLGIAMALVTFPLLPFVLPRLGPVALMIGLICLAAVLAASTSYLQTSVFAIAALWGSQEMLAVMSGQGGIAVLISVVQTYLAVLTTYTSKGKAVDPTAEETRGSVVAGMGLWGAGALALGLCFMARRRILRHHKSASAIEDLAEAAAQYEAIDQQQDEDVVAGSPPVKGSAGSSGDDRLWAVFRKNVLLEFSVAWVFVVTLAVFPPVTVTIVSVNPSPPKLLSPSVFIPLHFLLFNVADYLGRTYGPNMYLPTSHARVTMLSLARTIFIPLFLACNTIVKGRDTSHTPWINSDLGYFLIVFAFGCSNGYISSICMILSSSPALNPIIEEEEKDIAGSLAAFSLVAGLAGGSLASFLVRWLMTGGNPLVS